MSFWNSQRADWSAGVVFAALVIAVCSVYAESAQASCGDYLVVKSTHGASASTKHSGAAADEQLATKSTRRIPTCRGPNCRRQQPASPSRAPIQQNASPDEDAIRLVDADPITKTPAYFCESTGRITSQESPLLLERPPRA
jgi:hypothetical protein